MQNRDFITYYGEYSLYHWLTMILKKEITLPDFQRYFVWDPKRTIHLMESFDRGMFVPPILIANFSGDNIDQAANYILDGQQRLSAILLTYLNVFPKEFERIIIKEPLPEEDSDINYVKKQALNWDFRQIQEIFQKNCNNDINNLRQEVKNSRLYHQSIDITLAKLYNDTNNNDIELYKRLNINTEFLKNKFLGYSYIKAIKPNPKLEKQLFANIFKNINTSAVKLRHNESRSALYWISTEKRKFFQPDFAENIKINKDKIDFTKYMALISDIYHLIELKGDSEQIYNEIAIGYARQRRFEEYIIKYVNSVIKDENSEIFGEFSKIFDNYQKDFERLETIINESHIKTNFLNTVSADLCLFGLFYWVLFKKRNLKLNDKIYPLFIKAEDNQRYTYNNKNLNRLGAIRERIKLSIKIYSKFLEKPNDN